MGIDKCPNCGLEKKMSIRQVDTDRDGRIVADIYSCNKCNSWVRVPKEETKNDEIRRLKERLAQLEK